MAKKALVNPTVKVNNIAVGIVPNSVKYNEGLGEQVVRTQVSGSTVETVYSDNAETKISKVGFQVYNEPEIIEQIRVWKTSENNNLIVLQDDDGFSRTFQNQALTGDYEVNLGSDATIEIEFMGDPAV